MLVPNARPMARCYVGEATDLSFFVMSDLGIVFGRAAGNSAEAEHIAAYAATDRPRKL